MAAVVEKKYVVKTRVHYALKGTPADGDKPAVPGKMYKLEAGDVCPPELVSELKKAGLLVKEGQKLDGGTIGTKPVSIGEPGTAGVYEELPSRDEDKPEPGEYAKRGR